MERVCSPGEEGRGWLDFGQAFVLVQNASVPDVSLSRFGSKRAIPRLSGSITNSRAVTRHSSALQVTGVPEMRAFRFTAIVTGGCPPRLIFIFLAHMGPLLISHIEFISFNICNCSYACCYS